MTSKCLKSPRSDRKEIQRAGCQKTWDEQERHVQAPEIEEKTRWQLCYLSNAPPHRQEIVLLHRGNGLMAKIRLDNGFGNQKSKLMEWGGLKVYSAVI